MASTMVRKSSGRTFGVAVLAALLAFSVSLVSCGDEVTTGPEEEEWDDATNLFPGLTVTDPAVAPSAAAASASELAAQPSSTGLAYISAAPGTFANVNTITVTNVTNGSSVTASAAGGGFDPTALQAESGDTLSIEVLYLSAATDTYFATVPPHKRPKVVRTVPPKGATEVVLESTILIVFTEPVAESSMNTGNIRLVSDGELLDGTFELLDDGLVVEFTPAEPLQIGTVYTLVITTGVLDLQGDQLEEETEVTFATENQIVSVSAGNYHACATGVDGTVFCWGDNFKGRCGLAESYFEPPRPVPSAQQFASMALGSQHTCGLTFDGDAYCWGWNFWGQLGRNGTSDSHSPVLALGGHHFVSLTLGSQHTCGVTADGDAYCWGRGDYLQIGPGQYETCTHGGSTYPCHKTPLFVGGDFELLDGGHIFTCGLKTSGLAFCWGIAPMGTGESGPYETCGTGWPCTRYPLAVRGGHSFVDLSAGGGHVCGVTAEGNAYCWGKNDEGRLGAGFISEYGTIVQEPQPVVGGHEFVRMAAGADHTCGLTGDGRALCWGSNEYGQLGTGQDAPLQVAEPVEVTGDHQFVILTSGSSSEFTCGLTVDKEVYCWGWNVGGQLGHDPETLAASNRPRKVLGLP